MRNDKENIIVTKTFAFALHIIEFSELFFRQKRFALANQIFKSGTSIGANVREAQNAESKADFIHKMKIAAKEADENGILATALQTFSTSTIARRTSDVRNQRNHTYPF